MHNKKSNNKINPIINVFFKVQIMQIILSVLLAVIASLIIYSTDYLSSKYYFYIITAVLALSDFVSGFYTGFKIKKNGMINAALFCMPINFLFILISMLINYFKIDFTMLFSTIIILSSSMLGGVLSVNYKSGVKKRVGR